MLTFEVSEILHLAPAKITPQTSLYDLGLDSLMGLELINALQTNVGVRLSPLAISENPSVDKLAKLLFEALTQSTRSDSTQTDYDEEVRRVSAQHASETTNLTGSL